MTKDIAKLIAKHVEELALNRGTEQKVSFTISGQFVAKKGEDYEQVTSFAVPYDKILAVALSKLNGVTVESIVKEAMSEDVDTTEIKKQASVALAKIKGQFVKRMSGKVTLQSSVLDICEIDACEYC